MNQPSDAYLLIRHSIIKAKRSGRSLQDAWNIRSDEKYEGLTKQVLHQQINIDYMQNVGITEDELNELHTFIDQDDSDG